MPYRCACHPRSFTPARIIAQGRHESKRRGASPDALWFNATMNKACTFLGLCLFIAACQQAPAPDGRLAAVAQRAAIDQLVAGDYPRALDARDWDAYVALFTDDGELQLGAQPVKGRDGIKG